ncbi:MAG: methyltransferase domain-containing protein [Alphaproteobacteria bacterium]|nr:methyltransferase domain-containing protein [Alphaproteobacteria bacterium]
MPESAANAAMQRHWNEVAGPRWVRLGGVQEARNVEVAALLIREARPAPGERVLDIGCGTGATALPLAEAVGQKGQVTGIDISEPMLEVARRRVAERGLTNVTLLLADAQEYPLPEAEFDLLTSRFGVMFFADPVAAFRNLIGAARPSGRLCLAVWAGIADNLHWQIPYEIALRRVGPPAPQPPHAPGPLAFSDADYLRGILEAAGFADVAIAPRAFEVIGESAAQEGELAAMLGPAGRLLDEKQADDATRQAIAAETAAAFAARARPDGSLRLPGTVLIAKGHRSR